jgi:hypothetical protein
MDYHSTPETAHETSKHPTPWGLFVGLFLILAIIVSGAYFTLQERIGPADSFGETQNVR